MCFKKLLKPFKKSEVKTDNGKNKNVTENIESQESLTENRTENKTAPDPVAENHDTAENKYLGRIIAIANQKGGVGKSTTAVNMSSYLGDLGYRTLLVDFDPQSNSTSGIGVDKDKIVTTIYDVIINNTDPHDAVIKTTYKNLYIIASSIQLAGAEVELVSSMKREYKLKNAIDKIKHEYDFIVIDCPPALGLLTINALTGAGEVLIPIQCEYYALEGLGQLVNTINLIKENLNSDLEVTGVVMTMFDQRTKLSEQVINEVKTHFPDKIYDTLIPRNIRLSEAPSYGKPIIDYDPLCKGALAYRSLTEEVIADGSK